MNLQQLLMAYSFGALNEEYSYVVRGAELECDRGNRPGVLNLPLSHGVYVKGKPVMNIADCVCGPDANISNVGAFGMCKLLNNICKPKIDFGSKWTDGKEDVLIEGEQALLSKSTLRCTCKSPGGIITITNDGQGG
ncbi:MAG: DUF4280 domain-containing protein [Paenibacillus macerans]|uniref:DUF4280 domain-containing protein n=1 Tax=Paenibacillus macerans TaxID=44252 RepID=UPI00291280C9|nr:DUF4280 domain-containing protein [Paenibacillus macerans]MDU7473929.1 DUF4280 domain-containing protein [Paenibacillus macerans]